MVSLGGILSYVSSRLLVLVLLSSLIWVYNGSEFDSLIPTSQDYRAAYCI